MEEKIKQYVHYQFRFDEREDIEELKEEIIANLTDRYEDLIASGKEPEQAYIEAIKSMGDFSEQPYNEIPEEYSVKPSIPDILLMSGAILSIFGLVITLLTVVTGTIITAISILTFSGAAYYLYSYSQYVRKEHMDIEKHNLLLSKIFKYMKTSFVFWAISLSLTFTSIVMSFFTPSLALSVNPLDGGLHNLSPESISNSINDFILKYIVVFLIVLVIFLLIFKNVYERLMSRYYILTGTKELKGKVRESYDYLYSDNNANKIKKDTSIKDMYISNRFIPILIMVTILINFLIAFRNLYRIDLELYILPLAVLLVSIILIILTLSYKIIKDWILIGCYYLWVFSTVVASSLMESHAYRTGSYFNAFDVVGFTLLIAMIFTILLFIRWKLKGVKISDKFLSNNFISVVGLIMFIMSLFYPAKFYFNYNVNPEYTLGLPYLLALLEVMFNQPVLSIFPLLSLILNLVLIIRFFKGKIKGHWVLTLGYYMWFLSIISIFVLSELLVDFYDEIGEIGLYAIVMIALLTLIIIGRAIVRIIVKPKSTKVQQKES